MNKAVLISVVFLVVILGITAGIMMHVYRDEKIEQAVAEDLKTINKTLENKIVVATNAEEEKVSPNASITFEIYYNSCGHSKVEKNTVSKDIVNKTKDELQELYPEWKVKKFSSISIVLYKEENAMCDNHYMVKATDGYISVYSIDKDGNEKLKNSTDISTQYLPEEDIVLLKKGIKANSNTELEQILSDYD